MTGKLAEEKIKNNNLTPVEKECQKLDEQTCEKS